MAVPPRAASGHRRGSGESPAGLGPQADARAFDPRGSACAFSEARKASALKPPLGRTPAFWLTEVKYSFAFLLSKHDFRDVARCSGNPRLEDGRLSGDFGELVNLPPGILCPSREPRENSAKKAGLGQETEDTPISNNNFYFILLYTL